MRHLTHNFQFVVIGGGFAGMCAAITAARAGIETALVQDRPVRLEMPVTNGINRAHVFAVRVFEKVKSVKRKKKSEK